MDGARQRCKRYKIVSRGTFLRIYLHISIKSRTFADVFMNKLRFRTPYAVIARGVLLYIWLKRLSILRKINFFIKKKWKKFGSIKKKQYLCTVKQIKQLQQ